MTYQQAINVAVRLIDARIRALAVNANLFDLMHLDTPTTRNAAEERKKLRKARDQLTADLPAKQLSF